MALTSYLNSINKWNAIFVINIDLIKRKWSLTADYNITGLWRVSTSTSRV